MIKLRRAFLMLLFVFPSFPKIFNGAAAISESKAVHAILGEARGEPQAGREAVGEALRNRAKLPYYRSRGVFKGVYGAQSHFTAGAGSQALARKAWRDSRSSENIRGAEYWFTADDLRKVKKQSWFSNLKFQKRIGKHYFYKQEISKWVK